MRKNKPYQDKWEIPLGPGEGGFVFRAVDGTGQVLPIGAKMAWAIEAVVMRQAKKGLLKSVEGDAGRVNLDAKAWLKDTTAKPEKRG